MEEITFTLLAIEQKFPILQFDKFPESIMVAKPISLLYTITLFTNLFLPFKIVFLFK